MFKGFSFIKVLVLAGTITGGYASLREAQVIPSNAKIDTAMVSIAAVVAAMANTQRKWDGTTDRRGTTPPSN